MLKIFEFVTELAGWFLIMLSPLLIFSAIGAIISFYIEYPFGLILGILVAFAGLVIGIALATREWKKKGTIYFLSRVSATPELDQKEEDPGKDDHIK